MMRYFLVLIILVCCLVRFVGLESVPNGFFIDEAAGATNILCLAQDGTSEAGISYPLFFPQFGAFFTAPYVYFGAAWVNIFGDSIASFRSIAAFFSVLTIIGIYFLSLLIFKNQMASLVATMIGAISPWSFQFSRIAWDPVLMPCFLVWGLFFLYKKYDYKNLFIGAVLMSLAMYAYPTARLQVPILLLALFLINTFQDQKYTWKQLSIFSLVLGVISLPLVMGTLNGSLQGRFSMLSIASNYFLDRQSDSSFLFVVKTFLYNMYLHFSPSFVLFRGRQ